MHGCQCFCYIQVNFLPFQNKLNKKICATIRRSKLAKDANIVSSWLDCWHQKSKDSNSPPYVQLVAVLIIDTVLGRPQATRALKRMTLGLVEKIVVNHLLQSWIYSTLPKK